jgi:hypothetical protein
MIEVVLILLISAYSVCLSGISINNRSLFLQVSMNVLLGYDSDI